MCMNGKREAACLKKMRIRAGEGERKKRESTIHTPVYSWRKFLRRNYYVPIEMSVLRKWMGLRFGSSFFYRCIIPPLSTTSGLATRRCEPRAFLLSSRPSLSLSLQAVIRSKGSTEKLRHAPRQVPIDIEQVREPSLFLSLEIKGVFSLFLSFVDNWKGYYREEMEVENRKSAILEETRVAFETVILIFQTRSRGGLEEPRKGRNYEEEGDEEARLSMCCTMPSERKNVKNLILIWIRSLPTRFSNSQRG